MSYLPVLDKELLESLARIQPLKADGEPATPIAGYYCNYDCRDTCEGSCFNMCEAGCSHDCTGTCMR